MSTTPPEEPEEPAGEPPADEEREPGGWLPPVPPGPAPGVFTPPQPSPGVFAPPPGQPQPGQPPPPPPPPAAAPPYQPYPPQPPYPVYPQQPGWQQYPSHWFAQTGEPGNGEAVTGFVLSIASVGLLVMSAGLSTILSLGLGIAGAIVGRKGRQKVDAGETRQHRGLGQAGFVIGIVGSVLSLLATLVWILVFVAAAEDENFLEDSESSWLRTGRAAALVALRALG
jgi:hypothetical protein